MSLLCSIVFFINSRARSRYLSLFFLFIQVYPVVSRDGKVHSLTFSFFYWVWSSGRDQMIRLYLKIPQNLFVSFPRTDSRLCICLKANIKLLAQFPVDHLAHPVVSSFILSLRLFTVFTNYVIIITTSSTISLLFPCVGVLHISFTWWLFNEVSQVSRILSIQAYANTAVVTMVSILPLIYSYLSHFSWALVTN